jgi:transcriptional regulator with XRE-family HTH domain
MAAKQLNEDQIKDAERLRKIFELRKEADSSWSQEKLAHACGWKTQGAVNQYLHGKIPLNLNAIKKFSLALNFSINEVSPGLAKEAAQLHTFFTKEQLQSVLDDKPIDTLHPDIQLVIKIMEGTDEDGKTLIRIKAQELAIQRRQFLNETKSFDLENLMRAQGLLSTDQIQKEDVKK